MTGGSRYLARKEQGRHLVIYYTVEYYISLCTNKLASATVVGSAFWLDCGFFSGWFSKHDVLVQHFVFDIFYRLLLVCRL